MNKIDVIISAFGKPWQTLCSLKSLLNHSNQHIDRIYLIEEKVQAWNDSVSWIIDYFDNIIHFIPKHFYYISSPDETKIHSESERLSFRYQYGIEKSDKKYVFITHTDMFYQDDIIGHMLSQIDNAIGIGLIGQCWNCPAKYAEICDSDKFNNYNPTYDEAINMLRHFGAKRSYQFYEFLKKENTKPLPECRLNDFACIIDREIVMKECIPNGNSSMFGSVKMLDTGCQWFRDMYLKGYRFVSYNIFKDCVHGYYTSIIKDFNTTGYVVQRDERLYKEAELFAKELFESL